MEQCRVAVFLLRIFEWQPLLHPLFALSPLPTKETATLLLSVFHTVWIILSIGHTRVTHRTDWTQRRERVRRRIVTSFRFISIRTQQFLRVYVSACRFSSSQSTNSRCKEKKMVSYLALEEALKKRKREKNAKPSTQHVPRRFYGKRVHADTSALIPLPPFAPFFLFPLYFYGFFS